MNFSIKNNYCRGRLLSRSDFFHRPPDPPRSLHIFMGARPPTLIHFGRAGAPTNSSRTRLILEPETDLLQAYQRGLTVFVLDLLGQARCIGDGVNLLLGFRHDHDQKATQLVGDVAEAAVLSARYSDHVKWLQLERVLAPITPCDLKTAGEAEKVLDRIEMAVQTGSVAGLALGNAHDQPTRALHRRSGAATLVIRRRHHRIDATRRHLFHRAGRNVVRLEILTLVGLQFVEAGEAGFHLLGSERLWSHGAPPIRALC